MSALPKDSTSQLGHRSALVVFARSPDRERKRFGLDLSRSRRLMEALLRRTLAVARTVRNEAQIIVVSDGAIEVGSDVMVYPQRGSGFGERFNAAVEDVAAAGFQRIVVVGADIPGLTANDIQCALTRRNLCIGPSADGGFYLIGLNANETSVLHDLPWQRRNLLSVLLKRAQVFGLPYTLDVRRDVDDETDVRQLWIELEHICRFYANGGPLFATLVRPTLRRHQRPRLAVTGIEPAWRRGPPEGFAR